MDYTLPSFKIQGTDFLKGNNSYDDYPDGGYMASTVGYNAFSKPGLLTIAPALGTNVDSQFFPQGIVAFASGNGTTIGCAADNSGNGRIGQVGSSGFVFPITDSVSATSRYYEPLYTDGLFYKGYSFFTNRSNIGRYDGGSLSYSAAYLTAQTDTRTSGTFSTLSGYPHPMCTFEDVMYFADGNYLHKNDNGVWTSRVFNVPTDYTIMCVFEYNAMIWIVADDCFSIGGDAHGHCKIFTWDGLADSWFDEYDVKNQILAAYVYRNNVYFWTRSFMGTWNGSALVPLFPVSNPVYKMHITETSDSLVWVDGNMIVRYGQKYTRGTNAAFHKYISTTQTGFGGIRCFSGNNLLVSDLRASTTQLFFISDLNAPASSGSISGTMNKRDFSKPAYIRAIQVETRPLASGQSVKPGFIDDQGNQIYASSNSGAFDNSVTEMAGKSKWVFDVIQNKKPSTYVYPTITLTAGVYVKSIEYFYEGSELKGN